MLKKIPIGVNTKQTEIGRIPEDWEVKRLGDLFNVKNGKTNSQDAVENGQYPLFDRSIEIKKSNKFLFDSEAIIVPGEGKEFIPRYFNGKFDLHQRAYAITPKDTTLHLKFFFYAVLEFKDYLSRIAVGSTVRSLRLNHLTSFPVPFPNISEQHRIASILGTLDDKIALNRAMNSTLESIGTTLFKHWFVDFEFPDEKGKPYKSSGGEMVDSELGEVPKGWEVERLNTLLKSIESGRRPKGGIDPTLKEGIPSIGAENINGLGFYDYSRTKYLLEEYFEQMKQGIVKDEDILLYKDGAQLGRKTLFGNGFPFSTCCVNEHVFILRANERLNQFFLYFWLDQNEVTENIKNLNANSAQPGINKESVGTLKVLVPERLILDRFNNTIKSAIEKIFLNCLESRKLSQIRDALLPKLMSGEIRVPVEVRT